MYAVGWMGAAVRSCVAGAMGCGAAGSDRASALGRESVCVRIQSKNHYLRDIDFWTEELGVY